MAKTIFYDWVHGTYSSIRNNPNVFYAEVKPSVISSVITEEWIVRDNETNQISNLSIPFIKECYSDDALRLAVRSDAAKDNGCTLIKMTDIEIPKEYYEILNEIV